MNNEDIYKRSKEVWENNLKLFPESKLHYPDESLVRLLSGRYVDVPKPPARLMDHGFGHGNNLLLAATKGYDCAGCEISENLIGEVRDLFERLEKKIDLRPIENNDIAFEDNSFDIVVSWNVIHYNGYRKAVEHVISELYRVLKPGGVLLLSTLHEDNAIFERMEKTSEESYRIVRESRFDNRQGLTFFAASSLEELAKMFSMFSEVKTGKFYFDLFDYDQRHAASLIYAVK